MGDSFLPLNGDQAAGVPCPACPSVKTRRWSDPESHRATCFAAIDSGCLEDNEQEDCICRYCVNRYQADSFYLEVMVSDRVDITQVHKLVLEVVEQTVVSLPREGGQRKLGVTLCGYYWDSQPGCRQVVAMASMKAHCVREKLESGLLTELASLRCEGAPDIVVELLGYDPGDERSRLANVMFWRGLCLERAWPKLLPIQAVRFGDPWDHASGVNVDGLRPKPYMSDDDDGESTPETTCASSEDGFNYLGMEKDGGFYDCNGQTEPVELE